MKSSDEIQKTESHTVDYVVSIFGRKIAIEELLRCRDWEGMPGDPLLTMKYWPLIGDVLQGNIFLSLCRHVVSCKNADDARIVAEKLNAIRIKRLNEKSSI